MQRPLLLSALATLLILSMGNALAADPAPVQEKAKMQKPEQIYGSQLMTPQERAEHRAKMRAAKTADEREQVRKENHDRMEIRAKEKGVTLPDEPFVRGSGMGGGRRP